MMSTISSVRGVVVGDAGVGKSCFVISWSSNSFPKPYLPMVRDNYVRNVTVCDRSIEVQLLDTGEYMTGYDALHAIVRY